VAIFAMAHDKDTFAFRASLATGYVSLALLGVCLGLGPARLIAGKRSPVSTDLRRDLGIWSALLGLAHVVTGLNVHMGGQMWKYFIDPARMPRILPRMDAFGLVNWTGLAATIVLLVLLSISNDAALRRLGAHRWKQVQRWNYVAAILIVLHGAAFALMDHRSKTFLLGFAVIVAATAALQLAGVREYRRTSAARRNAAMNET